MTDTMLLSGAQKLARLSPAILQTINSPQKPYSGEALLPDFGVAPKVNFEIGVAVAQQAVLEGSSQAEWVEERKSGHGEDWAKGEVKDMMLAEVKDRAEKKLWVPVYPDYEYDKHGLED